MAVGWRKDYLRYQRYFLNLFAVYKNRDDVKAFLEIIMSLATVTFFVIFALKPTIVTITQILKDIDSKQTILTTLKHKTENLGLAQDLYNQELDRVLLLSAAVSENAQVEDYLRQISSISSKYSVTLTNLKIEGTVLKGSEGSVQKSRNEELAPLPAGSKGFSVTMSANGSYSDLVTFLQNVEGLRRPIWLDETNFSLRETAEGNLISLSIKGRVVYEGDDTQQ